MGLAARNIEPDITTGDAGRVALTFFFNLMEHWGCSKEQQCTLLGAIGKPAPLAILDLGCGPGRDLKAFTAMGHHATGVDGCPRFVEMARAYSGCTVWQQDFVDLDLPAAHFDGVFANAVLFHVPSAALPERSVEVATFFAALVFSWITTVTISPTLRGRLSSNRG